MQRDSDLAPVRFIALLVLAVIGTLAAFFFVGVILGVIVLLACVVLGIAAFARFIRRNETNEAITGQATEKNSSKP